MVRKAHAVGRKPTRTTIKPTTQPSPASERKADGLYPDNECSILPSLSTEIWELILDNVEDRATLYNLCRTNRRFYNSTIPRLYRQLAVAAVSFDKIPRLIRTLEPLLSIKQRKKLMTEGQYTGQSAEYPSGLNEDETPACAIYVREFVVGMCSPGRKHIYILERYLEEALKNMPNLKIVQTSVLTASIARSIASLQHLQALCIISDGSSIRHAEPLKRLRNLRHLSVIEGFTEDSTEPWQTIIANSSSTLQSLEQCTVIYDIDNIIGIGCDEQGQYAPPLIKLNSLKINGIWNHERRVDSVLKSLNFLNLQQLTINHDKMEGTPVAAIVPRLTSIFEAAMATTEPISLRNLTIKVDQLDQIELWARLISSFESLKRLEVLNYGNYNDGHLHHPDLSPDLLEAICKHQNLSQCIFSRDWRSQSRYPKFSPGTIRMLVDSLPLLQEVAFYVAQQDLTGVISGLTRAKNLTNLRLDPVTDEDQHGFCLPPDKALDKMLNDLVEIVFREAMPHLQSGGRFIWEQYSPLKYIALGHYHRWELASTFSIVKNAKEKRKKLVVKTDDKCKCEVWTRRVTTPLPERGIGYDPNSDWLRTARQSHSG